MKKGLDEIEGLSSSEVNLGAMFREAQKGNTAVKEELVIRYMPNVKVLAARFAGQGVDYEDLLQEGYCGLIEAIGKFDPDRKVSFNTYSSYYIKKYIRKAMISQSIQRPIIYKEDFYYDLMRYHRTFAGLQEKLGRVPTDNEVAEEMNTTVFRVRKLRNNSYSFLPSELINIEGCCSIKLNEFDRVSKSAEDDALAHISCIDLSSIGVTISKIEEEILCRRFGMTKRGEPESLYDIAKSLGCSYEAVRAVYAKTIQELREALGYSRKNF